MSLEAVLKCEPNVMSLSETPVLTEIPIWDRLVNLYSDEFGAHELNAFILIPDFYKSQIIKESLSKIEIDSKLNFENIGTRLNNQTLLKFSKGDMNFPVTNPKLNNMIDKKITEFKNLFTSDFQPTPYSTISKYLFNININFPEKDINEVIDLYLQKFQIEKSFENISTNSIKDINLLIDKLEELAYLKVIKPSIFKHFNIGEIVDYVSDDYEFICFVVPRYKFNLMASLKILSAEEVRIGKKGFEFKFPNEKIEVSYTPLPSIRRFS